MSVFHWQFLITYIFSASLKCGACYIITGLWGEFSVKNANLCLHILFFIFLFFIKNLCFYDFQFFFFFWWSIKFPQRNIKPIRNRNWWWEILSGTVCYLVLMAGFNIMVYKNVSAYFTLTYIHKTGKHLIPRDLLWGLWFHSSIQKNYSTNVSYYQNCDILRRNSCFNIIIMK